MAWVAEPSRCNRGRKRGGQNALFVQPFYGKGKGKGRMVQTAKSFRRADDELSLIRNGVVASLNLGLDTARLHRNLHGILVPTALVPVQKCLKEALEVAPNLQNPMEEMAARWRALGKGLSAEAKLSKEVKEQLVLHTQQVTKNTDLYGIVTYCSVYPCFENKEMIKVELNVQPELRTVLVLYFKALLELGGTVI
eukprot:TRINITY_DN73356_c0_g1_i1.p2 TRINITY_DN73356_c0_g1~~TRINITY_DN73356_c0_g1_i1.p2  ORF type:complete len:195 (-),score=27.15 TRINITY_DN73356_c0_g1_i1:306-890(-)